MLSRGPSNAGDSGTWQQNDAPSHCEQDTVLQALEHIGKLRSRGFRHRCCQFDGATLGGHPHNDCLDAPDKGAPRQLKMQGAVWVSRDPPSGSARPSLRRCRCSSEAPSWWPQAWCRSCPLSRWGRCPTQALPSGSSRWKWTPGFASCQLLSARRQNRCRPSMRPRRQKWSGVESCSSRCSFKVEMPLWGASGADEP